MTILVTYWKVSDGGYLGYLNAYPHHWTQGDTLSDLKEHLLDLYDAFSSEEIPGIRKEEELEVPLRGDRVLALESAGCARLLRKQA